MSATPVIQSPTGPYPPSQTQSLTPAPYARQPPYGQNQPPASSSYQQAPPAGAYNQHYRSPYHQPYQQAPYQQQPPASQYGTRAWPYQYTSYPAPGSHAATYGQPQNGQPAAHYPPPAMQSGVAAYGASSQRPAYTSMSYQPYTGYKYGSGVSTYPQLSQAHAGVYHTSPSQTFTTPGSSNPADSAAPQRPASATTQPPAVPTPQPPAIATPPPPPPTTHKPPPPPTPSSNTQFIRPARILAPSTKYPPAPLTTQFHVTTPQTFVANELRWQQPYTGPKGLSPAPAAQTS